MRPFDYARAATIEEAAQAAAAGATIIAGGTNLLDLMKLEVMAPDRLVDVNRLGLDAIEPMDNGGLGSATAIWPPMRGCASTTRCSPVRCSPAHRGN